MSIKIVCFSASSGIALRNYNKTVGNPIVTKDIVNKLCIDDSFSSLNEPNVSIWALRESKKNALQWSKLNRGDISLFYSQFNFVSYGEILFTVEDEEIANFLWEDPRYKYLIIMKPNVHINSPRDKFWEAFKYSNRATIQGMMIPNLERQKKKIEEYNGLKEFLQEVLLLEEFAL